MYADLDLLTLLGVTGCDFADAPRHVDLKLFAGPLCYLGMQLNTILFGFDDLDLAIKDGPTDVQLDHVLDVPDVVLVVLLLNPLSNVMIGDGCT